MLGQSVSKMNVEQVQLEVESAFRKAVAEKERGRVSEHGQDALVSAARAFRRAAVKSESIGLRGAQETVRRQAKTFASYYRAEAWSCLRISRYEERRIDAARRCLEHEVRHLELAISGAEEAVSLHSTNLEDRAHLERSLRVWRFYFESSRPVPLLLLAREAWDSGDLVRALDQYRRAEKMFLELKGRAESDRLDPVYVRVASGNVLGMRANAASALVRILQQRPDPERPLGDLEELVGLLGRAIRESEGAFRENPEWAQYRKIANHSREGLRMLLDANRGEWRRILESVDGDRVVRQAMADVDDDALLCIESGSAASPKLATIRVAAAAVLVAVVVFVVAAGVSLVIGGVVGVGEMVVAAVMTVSVSVFALAAVLRLSGHVTEAGFVGLIRGTLEFASDALRRAVGGGE